MLAGLATWLSPRASELVEEPLLPALWIGAGVLLLFGVTGELDRFFLHRSLERNTAALWTGLSISAARSEERRVGKECRIRCRSRWSA
jgi:hypothetical protein